MGDVGATLEGWLARGPAHELFMGTDGHLVYRYVSTNPSLSTRDESLLPGILGVQAEGTWLARDGEAAWRQVPDPVACYLNTETGAQPAPQVVWTLLSCLETLAPLHTLEAAHGALTQSRIGYTRAGVVLTDCGVVQALQAATGETLRIATPGFGDLFGPDDTPAPELISGGAISPSTDVFMLGAIGHLLLTGEAAHGSGPAMTRYRRICAGDHVVLDPNEWGAIAGWLNDALDPDPARRPTLQGLRSLPITPRPLEWFEESATHYSDRFTQRPIHERTRPWVEQDPAVMARLQQASTTLETLRSHARSPKEGRTRVWILLVAAMLMTFFLLKTVGGELDESRRDRRPPPALRKAEPSKPKRMAAARRNPRRAAARGERRPRAGLEGL